MNKLFSIAKNTFIETIRQPVYSVIIVAALFLLFISPSITMYSLKEDVKLLREICLSTLFLTGLFISIFSAAGAIAEEIENKTILTIISKPVPRPVFIFAKFLGVTAAVLLAQYICTLAMLFVMRQGILEDAQTVDWTVAAVLTATILLSLIISAFLNYLYDWRFNSTAIILAAALATIGLIFLAFIDPQWQFNPANNGMRIFDVYASILLFFACVIIVALSIAFSSRFNIVATLSFCVGIFLLGLISDYVFGQLAQTYQWAQIGRFIVPNFQVFWISDAIYEGSDIPFRYILISSSYAACYTLGILSACTALFQRRQVG